MSEQKPTEFGPAQPMGDGGAWGASGVPYAPDPQPLGAPSPTQLDTRSPARRNWWALAALAHSLVIAPAVLFATGSVGWMTGVWFFGIAISSVAVAKAKEAERPLRKTANWAMALALISVAVWMVVFGVFGERMGWGVEAEVRFKELDVGDCVQSPQTTFSADGQLNVETIDRVLCKDEHWGQVYYVKTLADGKYPGDAEVSSMADEACFSDDAVNAILPSKLGEAWMALEYPTRESWKGSDHNVVCFLTQSDEALFTGSWVVAD